LVIYHTGNTSNPFWGGKEKKADFFHLKGLISNLFMDEILNSKSKPVAFKEWSKFPAVTRDLALVVEKKVSYSELEQIALTQKIESLNTVSLFDVFESEKLGADKKSMAMSFTFRDENKTLTDKEIDAFMDKIILSYEKNIGAEIRK